MERANIVALGLLMSVTAGAAIEVGISAYQGHYATAFREFSAAAESGNPAGLVLLVFRLAAFALLVFSIPALAMEAKAAGDPADDIRILDRAKELLADERRWNRKDTRECLPKEQTISLFCALHRASIEVLGQYDHRRAALEEVRLAIEELSRGRRFEHRLMDFNNLPATTFSDVKQVLSMARAKIAARARWAQPARQTARPTESRNAPRER